MAEFCHFENLMVLPTSFNKGAELKPFAPPNQIFARSGLVLRQIRSNGWIYALTYSAFQKTGQKPLFLVRSTSDSTGKNGRIPPFSNFYGLTYQL
jgi:hypothetical protein